VAECTLHAGKDPIKEHLWRCTDASDAACRSVFQDLTPTDRFCNLQPSQWEWTHPHDSVRSDLGLICGRAWILQVSNSIFFLGFLCGAAVAGMASDKYGRKRSFMFAISLSAVATALPALASSVFPFILFRFFQGVCPENRAPLRPILQIVLQSLLVFVCSFHI
jgi:MFS family permease